MKNKNTAALPEKNVSRDIATQNSPAPFANQPAHAKMATEAQEKIENTDVFPCPGCGGNMRFDPDAQSLICPYCNHTIDITAKEGDIHEYDLDAAVDTANTNWGTEKRVFQCKSCGAKTVLDATATAQFCVFCGSSHVLKIEEIAGIAPESLVPFKISREKAQNLFATWIKGRLLAPKALKSEYQNQRMTGVYIPHWTYDADTYSTYHGLAGHYYYEQETVWVEENGERKQVTRTVQKIAWYPVSGIYASSFDDIVINASQQIDEKLMEKLQPFRLNELIHYKPEFLSGFLAERYSRGLKEGWEKAKALIKSSIHDGVMKEINADQVTNLNIATSFNSIKYKHLLLPVWISSYTYRGKVYQYMINGQTGEVQGKSPLSPWKVGLLMLLGLVIVGGVFWWMRTHPMNTSW